VCVVLVLVCLLVCKTWKSELSELECETVVCVREFVRCNMSFNQGDRNQEATVWAGNLEPQVTDKLIWELMVQVGPVGT